MTIHHEVLKRHFENIHSLAVAIQRAGGVIEVLNKPDVKDFLATMAMNGVEITATYTKEE